ncbi:hypothetical protein C8J56DRAFT_1052900 [Mycena floridula]|nr:hypothetical protein C8J56DRAFT_1052900 [Mycena floridula]
MEKVKDLNWKNGSRKGYRVPADFNDSNGKLSVYAGTKFTKDAIYVMLRIGKGSASTDRGHFLDFDKTPLAREWFHDPLVSSQRDKFDAMSSAEWYEHLEREGKKTMQRQAKERKRTRKTSNDGEVSADDGSGDAADVQIIKGHKDGRKGSHGKGGKSSQRKRSKIAIDSDDMDG